MKRLVLLAAFAAGTAVAQRVELLEDGNNKYHVIENIRR
jgi:hypothetical protein